MTSSNFVSLPVGGIIVNRPERQRKELPNIPILADSISRLGLIHPIVITRDNVLVAGERRLEAIRSLGWTSITCQYFDDLDPAAARAVELEENIKREALPWQDECKAVAEYHALRASEEPDWTLDRTGEALGLTKGGVSQKLSVARELAAGNKMVLDAPKFSTARGIVCRTEERRADAAILAITKRAADPDARPDAILNVDFNEWAETYDGPKFNFIHCDFPYGIGASNFNQGSAASHGGYDDSEDVYWKLCRTLCDNLGRLASESCHVMFWYSMHYHTETLKFFSDNSDFDLNPFPLIWTKSDNVGILPDPERGPRRIYETCLFGSRGDRKIVRPVANSFYGPSDRSSHMSIKPVDMLSHFFRMFVDRSTFFLDPTCGSGSSVRAASTAGASFVQGLELNPEFAKSANATYNKECQNEPA